MPYLDFSRLVRKPVHKGSKMHEIRASRNILDDESRVDRFRINPEEDVDMILCGECRISCPREIFCGQIRGKTRTDPA